MTDSWHNRNAGAEWTGSWILVESFDTTITEDHPGANAYFWSLS